MYSEIARNKRNTFLIILLFIVIIAGLGMLASVVYGNTTIVIFTLVGACLYAVFQYFMAARQAIAMSGAIEIQKSDNPRLFRTVENLSITMGMPMPKVYIVNDPSPNAFATGKDPENAVVAATTGLLELLEDSELEGVLAHEMGHVKNYDIRVSLIVFGLVVAVGFIADMLMRMAFFGRQRENNNPFVMIFGLVAMIVAPLVASLVQLAISRQREYLADSTGAMTTRHPEALASALEKIAYYGQPMLQQNSSMAHLWIADPLKPGLVARLMSTHPPMGERIERLRTMGSKF